MYTALALATSLSAAVGAYLFTEARDRTRTPEARCLIDPVTPREAEALLRAVSRERESTEALITRLIQLYDRFPPREASMRHLSIEQQRLSGLGSAGEFAVCTVYGAMMLSIENRRRAAYAQTPSRPALAASLSDSALLVAAEVLMID